MFVPPLPQARQGRRGLFPWFGLWVADPYWWTYATGDDDQLPPAAPLPQAGRDRPPGGLQLDVEPRRAQVYVDGWLAGSVEEFSGYYHHLDLAAGPHIVEVLASGYDPLVVEVAISPGNTTTYRGSLNRR